MKLDIFTISFVISIGFTASILYLIRARKLKEQYAMLWLLLGLVMTVLSLFPSLLDKVASGIGVSYAPSLLYLFGLAGVLFILLHLTMAVSSLAQRVIVLTQTVALQEQRLAQGFPEAAAGLDPAADAAEGGDR
ncbi:DUF2304 domain-containing protein [Cohnella nanjingensis]|uniref:DUF2304 domain-containing protein n=1 Tax=Cohnella nanjingensis TaxID=1387779 RepID=A0A7X0VFV2_9BACL|nr:DUF2304 domain-containing protein [Cohnella nanjingensis]MBB6671004.1 DUF2304 domain-containing protein [Cohnella nanjingensis]